MNSFFRLTGVALITALLSACAGVPAPATQYNQDSTGTAMPGMQAPVGPSSGNSGVPRLDWAETLVYDAAGPYTVDLTAIPPRVFDPNNQLDRIGETGRIEKPVSEEVAELMRQEAMLLPPDRRFDQVQAVGPEKLGPVMGVGFDSLDYTDCCGGGGNVPPDPELAVGPNHIIAVVNVAFEIYDKSGALLSGPTTFSSFFAGTPGCSSTAVFDPNVIYDEDQDRFILGIDGNGTDYCIAATTGPDPMSTWNRYAFATDIGGNFFDYPHAGVGQDAIYMGGNMFGAAGFAEGRVWAIDKFALYNGLTVGVVTHSTGSEDTPQPMNLHGADQATWPLSGPHYILIDGAYNGTNYGVWSWDDPFGADILVDLGTVDIEAFVGMATGQTLDAPQAGSNRDLDSGDFRVQDAEYRNGTIWMSSAVSCNPGSGSVNCVQWAQIDPSGPTLLDAGVYGTNGEYRIHPDLAVNDCDDMAIGYTKTSDSMFPATFVTGRESSDPGGSLQPEVLLKAGEITYSSFESSGPYRWGDYTGMTIDPDGRTFWYLGEYSKDTGTSSGHWGTYIGSFSFPACSPVPQPPGKATNPDPADGAGGISLNPVLSWSAGSGATSHDVYFAGNFVQNQTGTSYSPPGPLGEGSVHTWRIDEKNDIGTTTGDTWTFTVLSAPGAASNPSPADTASDVTVDVILNWNAGSDATSHDVIFNGAAAVNQTGTTFDPGTLDPETTYQWSVDEINDAGTTTGPTWTFTTAAISSFYIKSVINSVDTKGRNAKGVATVTVLESDNSPAAGVFVSGIFSGHWDGVRSGTTGTNGVVVISTPNVKNGTSFDFCVDTASKSGWDLDHSASSGMCGAPPATGTISGTVTDADTSGPIMGASISADTGQNDTTDASGDYTLNDVPTGTRTVEVSASGYDPASDSTTVIDGATSTLNFVLTPSDPSSGSVQVRSITMSTVNQGRGNKSGHAEVVVEDSVGGSVVSGAEVSGYFTGTIEETPGSETTDASGNAAFETLATAKGGVSVTFCVTSITHPTLTNYTGPEVCQSL